MQHLFTFIVFLHLLRGSATQAIEADCNDHNIFNAVDEALRHHNRALTDGNKFVLYRITEAKIKIENDSGTHNFVSYDIREGSCGVKSGKVWQNCDFKQSDEKVGKCSAHVLVNKELKSSEVIFQNCSTFKVEPTVTAVEQGCLGCPIKLDTTNEELLPLIKVAMEKMNKVANHPFYFNLETITEATRQVVFGWNYKLFYTIRQTNCSKSIHSNVPLEECNFDANGGTHEKTYDVKFNIQETNCSKSDYSILGEECEFIETKEALNCDAKVNITDTKITVASSPMCIHRVRSTPFFSYKGLSPFRMVLPQANPSNKNRIDTERAKRHAHGHGHKEEQKHGRKHKKERKDKKDKKNKKNGHKNGDSSEESQEHTILLTQHTTAQTVELITSTLTPHSISTPGGQTPETTEEPTLGLFPQIPSVPEDQDNFFNFHDNVEPDLPGPEDSNLPKCPGNPWEPVKLPITEPVYDPFDLAFAIEDTTTTTTANENIKNKEPGSQGQPFNDEDLLLSLI
eukprot:XP_012818785.1 PREDICTED: kininogen-1 isoform X2 [Xenopus tropicalis]